MKHIKRFNESEEYLNDTFLKDIDYKITDLLNKVDDKLKVNEINKDVFHRNDWGVLWVTECETYRTLRDYSRALGLDFNTFQKVLVEYLNNKYKEEFFDKPIKNIGDEHFCIEEEN